jgi:hypothetical protein
MAVKLRYDTGTGQISAAGEGLPDGDVLLTPLPVDFFETFALGKWLATNAGIGQCAVALNPGFIEPPVPGTVTARTQDGATVINDVNTFVVPNGSLIDEGGGVARLSGTGGGSGSVGARAETYLAVATSGREVRLHSIDHGTRAGTYTRASTILTVTLNAHGFVSGQAIIARRGTFVDYGTITAVNNLGEFELTCADVGGLTGDLTVARAFTATNTGSALTINRLVHDPALLQLLGGSARVPAVASSPLAFDYGSPFNDTNTGGANVFPPQLFQWREDTGAMVLPGTTTMTLTAPGVASITMPGANRILRFNF